MTHPARNSGVALLHLFTLSTLGISQPLFDLLGANIQFFLFRSSGAIELGAFIFIAWTLIPAFLYLIYRLGNRVSHTLGDALFICSVFLLLSLISMQLTKRMIEAPDSLTITVALLASAAITVTYCRAAAVRSLLSFMGLIVPLAPAVFLYTYYSAVIETAEAEANPPVAGNPAPVVMVIFDELPLSVLLDEHGGIDQRRFPNFAKLAQNSNWYRNASTVSDNTSLAVPAMLTGTLPDISVMDRIPEPTLASYPRNLFTLLEQSHQVIAQEAISRLCPQALCMRASTQPDSSVNALPVLFEDIVVVYLHILLPEGARSSLPPLHQNWGGFRLIKRPTINLADYHFNPKTAAGFVESIAQAQGTVFHFLHLMLPHQPWTFYPTGTAYTRPADGNMIGIEFGNWHHTWGHNLRALEVAFQRQIMQVAYADKILGKILGAIETSANRDETLLIVTSDHGANISAGGQLRWAYAENLREIMAVPLFIRYPQQTQAVVELDNVELVDILPTIDELMEIDSGWTFQGQSLLHNITRPRKVLLSPAGKNRDQLQHTLEWQPDDLLVQAHPLRAALTTNADSWIFALAAMGKLAGRDVDDIRVQASGQTAHVENLSAFSRVKPRARFVPGLVRIQLPKDWIKGTQSFAIALNGIIQATATVDLEQGLLFDTILPQRAFRKGKNDLSLYLISQNENEAPTLLSLTLAEGEIDISQAVPGQGYLGEKQAH